LTASARSHTVLHKLLTPSFSPLVEVEKNMTAGQSAAHPLRWAGAIVAGLVVGLLSMPVAAMAQQGGNTQLGAADMALFNGVRQAGLWEMPAGQLAAEKGNQPRVREIGAEIAKQHVELDKIAVEAANKLGVQLPTEATSDQKGWVNEMKDAEGARFDRIFVERLRAAHGAIFPVIAAVRSGTRNDTVRDLAQAANDFVLEHMTLLESTGLVRYTALPPVALPPPADDSVLAVASANNAPGSSINGGVIWFVLFGALLVGAIATFRVVRR
jgi:predicted outer membrane protein